ncbi:hypothetical protein BTVI_120383 [Pitangus sulphuratus]|nr:hypothetical protein BTVI_120383 [Pitangus sulphuratus]
MDEIHLCGGHEGTDPAGCHPSAPGPPQAAEIRGAQVDHALLLQRDKFRDYFQDFNNAFHKADKNSDGSIKICGLHRTLQEFNYYFDDHQFNSLPNSLGISIHESKLSYSDFLRAIEDGRASEYQHKQKQSAPPASFAVLSLEQTLAKIKQIVTSP